MDKKIINTHDAYLALQSEPIKSKLELLRFCIRKVAPEAEEVISYQMPAFKYHGMLAYYACFKNHYSLFVSPDILNVFKNRLAEYKITKSAIHFSFNLPLDEELIDEIISLAVFRNDEKKILKEAKKSNKPDR